MCLTIREMNINLKAFYIIIFITQVENVKSKTYEMELSDKIEIIDLSHMTTWRDMKTYYGALEQRWKICVNCGNPSLGTGMHLGRTTTPESMHPAGIPPEFLITRLVLIDVSSLTKLQSAAVLTLDVALQWFSLKHDPLEPTLLLFKFGWKEEESGNFPKVRNCVCSIPGISYELAEWIAANLSHVVGVATDAPTLESDETREFSRRTVSNLLGKNGVFIIENVNIKRGIPEQGCMAIIMPLKLQNANYVPTRLTAFCPSIKTDLQVDLALKKSENKALKTISSRLYDVNIEEILNQ